MPVKNAAVAVNKVGRFSHWNALRADDNLRLECKHVGRWELERAMRVF